MNPRSGKSAKVLVGFSVVALAAVAAALSLRSGRTIPTPERIPRIWASTGAAIAETDSLAVCGMPDGSVRLFATCKKAHRIDVFDAATGKFLKSFGTPGSGPGRLNRPNGIVAVRFPPAPNAQAARHAVMVIERDGARVQAFWADTFAPAGSFGSDLLVRPYGGAVHYGPEGITLYVTDAKAPNDECVLEYRIDRNGEQVTARFVRRIGDSGGDGVVELPESIAVDAKLDRLLICDEENNDVKVYTRAGQFNGSVFAVGLIDGDPEGIEIVEGLGREGVVILTGQEDEITNWFVFDRRDYALLGAFTGRDKIANTDGICVHPAPFGPFTGGALFAVNDDADIHAFDLADIQRLLTRWKGAAGAGTTQRAD